jgi:hypothetical protein
MDDSATDPFYIKDISLNNKMSLNQKKKIMHFFIIKTLYIKKKMLMMKKWMNKNIN